MANIDEVACVGSNTENVGRRGHCDGEVEGMITYTCALP